MRLICPNCDAQYEVPDEVMPTSGRDVQCSNCGQTWFQHHPDYMPQDDPDAPEDDALGAEDDPDFFPKAASQGAPTPVRKQLDPSVADILRQEAEAEQAARQSRQAETLESQPDLGLDNAGEPSDSDRAQQAKERMARLRGEEVRTASEVKATAAAIGSRRDLLPDIEEINSTLRSDTTRRNAAPAKDTGTTTGLDTAEERRGFSAGFLSIVVLATLLIMIYVFAPKIAAMVPGVDPYLSAFVAWVDNTRLWLDEHLQSALQWLDAKASQSGT